MLWNTTAAPADEACAVSNSPSFVSLEISGDTNCGTVSLHPKEGSRKQVSGSELSSAIKWLVENGPNLTSIAIRDLAISGDVALDGLHPTQSILFERDEILGTLRISSLKSSGTLSLTGIQVSKNIVMEDSQFQAVFGSGVNVSGDFVAAGLKTEGQLLLSRGRFNGAVNLNEIRTGSHILIDKSVIVGAFEMQSARVGGQLFLDGTHAASINIQSSRVEEMVLARDMVVAGNFSASELIAKGQVDISDSTAWNIDLQAADIGPFLLARRAKSETLILAGAKISGQVDLDGFLASRLIDLEEASIGNSALLRRVDVEYINMRGIRTGGQMDLSEAIIGSLRISEGDLGANFLVKNTKIRSQFDANGISIGGQLTFLKSSFFGNVLLENSRVEDNVYLRESHFSKVVSFVYSEVLGSFDLSASRFADLSLTGTSVSGELRIGSDISNPFSWSDDGVLDIRGMSVGGLESFPNKWIFEDSIWPKSFLVDGFKFGRLSTRDRNPLDRSSEWYRSFLGRMQYSPGVYAEFANYFDGIGQDRLASDVRYYSSERRRSEAKDFLDRSVLFFANIFVGHGQRLHFAFFWAAGFIVVGGCVLLRALRCGDSASIIGYFVFSFDRFIPFIEIDPNLDKKIARLLTGWAKYYFYVHSIMGYLVGIFLVAAITGLTK